MSETVKLTPTQIVRSVAERRGLSLEELRSISKAHRIAHAKHEACWELKRRTKLSLVQIAERVGLTDHTSAHFGVRAHERRLEGGGLSTLYTMCVDSHTPRQLEAFIDAANQRTVVP
jgi:chromosomal replication initiation ATPase DnaA